MQQVLFICLAVYYTLLTTSKQTKETKLNNFEQNMYNLIIYVLKMKLLKFHLNKLLSRYADYNLPK